jgi:acetamidase/formamidase
MAKSWLQAAVFGAVLAVSGMAMAAPGPADWVATLVGGQGEPQYAHVTLKIDGAKVSGTWGASTIEGTLAGDKLDAKLLDAEGKPAGSFSGTLAGDKVTGIGTFPAARGRGGMGGGGRGAGGGGPVAFTLSKAPAAPAAPRSIKFVPENFYATYSAANKPALTIFPGDVVHTWTADAGGVDAEGTRHRGGDSNIGPFYVEGALPGDTLVVHLLKIRTNRSTAHQGTRMNAHSVTAAYLVGAQYDPAVTGDWTLLPEKGIAVPKHPSEHMKNYGVPLKPMLGCISVAPAGDEQYRGGDLGPYGGNMDYNDNVEGTTLLFPVFHPGALLGMGDGHAAMGDGEVTGSALETSMDVDFSVEVIRGDSSGMVRAETKDYLVAFGVSGSVPESIQIATSQLATWIKKQYKLNDSEVAILFAATLKYDVTELVDSQYNVVAKVPKSVLATMK